MKSYTVEIIVKGKYQIKVNAENRSEALQKAMEKTNKNSLWSQVLDDVTQEIVVIHSTFQEPT